ncbi:MAG: hypothetical protein IMZ71_01565, partial [Chloroflexi bacterium]|nr:hypothetical protein [Chloroflexota bacterium]
MSLINSYATVQNFLDFRSTTDTDTVDDGVIEILLNSTSRYMDSFCSRTFYPRMGARLFDVPAEILYLDDDLCEVTALLNGDSTTISTSDYTLLSANLMPKWGVKLKDSSSLSWLSDASASGEQVISLDAVWAYHNEYASKGWTSVGTLAAAMTDTTTLAFTMSNGHTVLAGNLLKIGTELLNAASVSSSDTVTPYKRGDNGSTAATHLISTTVYLWNTQPD